MIELVGYLLLFLMVGIGFIFVHLVVGKLVRPDRPDAEKMTIYECGEPTIGSAWVQFDLRFYVVALLFVIFDVEVAFFFPWAAVFGQANAMAKPEGAMYGQTRLAAGEVIPAGTVNNDEREGTRLKADTIPMKVNEAAATVTEEQRQAAQTFVWIALGDILVFFLVLLVGFMYLWARGDLKWVRALSDRAVA